MIIRSFSSWCFIFVFTAMISNGSLQVTVEGVIGFSALLPCSSTEFHVSLQDINVLWRHNGSEIIYNLVKGNDSVLEPNPRYKNRAKPFPKEYVKGNFSIRLNNLQHNDAGEFICFITHPSDSKQESVWLKINESTEKKGSNSTEPANREPETKAHQWYIPIICVCIFLGLVSVLIYKFCLRKKPQAAI